MKPGRTLAALLLAFALLPLCLPALAAGGKIDSPALLEKIRPGVTTAPQVKEMLGEPYRVQRFDRRGVDAWDYWMFDWGERVIVSVEFDDKGVVRGVERIRRFGP